MDAGSGKSDIKGFSTVLNGVGFAYITRPEIAIISSYSGSSPVSRFAGQGISKKDLRGYFYLNQAGVPDSTHQ
jgi:hypothetical protein